ncbi:MAG: hypothetical protein RTV41_04995 [Candidatus Thorarchaeota archaeon]
MKAKDINNTPSVNNDKTLGRIELVTSLNRTKSNDWPKMKKDTVRIGETTKETNVLLARCPCVLTIQNNEKTTSVPSPVETNACMSMSVIVKG